MELNNWLKTDFQKNIWLNKYRYENETLDEWFDRISNGNEYIKNLIINKKFLAGGRILSNRGLHKFGRKVTYSNCYVIAPPEDNLESIFKAAYELARTFSYGGGCGLDISKLAPKGAKINNAAKETTGSVSFMELYSLVTQLIGQNGRRGALMISLDCDHPDLEDFINIKNDLTKVTKANISIKISDKFMDAVNNDLDFELKFTRIETGESITKIVKAKEIFRKIAESNWRMAEPGNLYWDRINTWSIISEDSNFEYAGVNPCAEEPLPAYGSCLLASLNLSAYVIYPFTDKAYFDFNSLDIDVRECIKFMNDILDEGLPLHPLKQQQECARDWRQIGLGIMGLGDMLIKLGVTYGSEKAFNLINACGHLMINAALQQSALLAKENGTYPKYNQLDVLSSPFIQANASQKTLQLIEDYGLYNSQLLTSAPTGSISNMLGVSSGIEPIYAISYNRKTESLHKDTKTYKVYTPIVEEFMNYKGFTDESQLPDYFVTALTLNYKQRIDMQAEWQKYIDASISSTVNVPESFTIEDTEELYKYAHAKGLKGVTIYRDNCERTGILTIDKTTDDTDLNEIDVANILEWGTTLESTDDLIGRKRKIISGCGSLHVNAYFDPINGKLMEIFLSKGSSGGCNSFMIGLSRMISAGLRTGLDFNYAIDQLNSVPECTSYVVRSVTKKDTSIGRCCPNAVAKALVEMQNEIFYELGINEEVDIDNKKKKSENISITKNAENICPSCQAELRFEGGCNSCPNCGWSKCN